MVHRDVALHISILREAFVAARVLACDGFGMRLLVTLRSWGVQYERWGWQVLQIYVFELVEGEGDGVSSS